MSDPYRPYRVSGLHRSYPFYGSRVPRERGCQSLIFKRMNIEVGQTVEIKSKDANWPFGAYFCATNLVYIGSPGLWILEGSNVGGQPLFGEDIPCETFLPGCPSAIDWPVFSCLGGHGDMLMRVENHGDRLGYFIVRLAGDYDQGAV